MDFECSQMARGWWTLLFVLVVAPIGCARSGRPRAGASPTLPTPSASPAAPEAGAPPADACTVTLPIEATEPESTEGGPPSGQLHHWYTNAEHSLWMFAGVDLTPGQRAKVAWFRAPGAQLEVSGRRLDAPGEPLLIDVPLGASYPHRFTPSSMTFPTEGCWEISAKAEKSTLRFVLRVPTPRQHDAGH